MPARDLEALVREMREKASTSRTPLRVVRGYIAQTSVPAVVADDAGFFIGANPAALALTGFTRAELLRRSVRDLTAPDDTAVEERLWNSFVRSHHQRGTYSLLRKTGRSIKVRYDAYAAIAPGIHVSFLTRRVSERRR